jgi:CRISPR-associated protein (TIGR02584 family)
MDLDPNRPGQYPRRILLAVTGMSPQIVTETIYALAVKPPPDQAAFVPTEIQIITTRVGREQAINNLLTPSGGKPGWFHRLCADYALSDINFDESCIHVMPDVSGAPLDDIRTPEDNERAADFITEKVRELTSDTSAALHVSLAGGRKTMGFYMGYALSLFARSQDRLSHVLVSRPYESQPAFYYPTPYDDVIHLADKTALNTRHAEVSLATIPVVSLRHGLPQGLLDGQVSFNATVAAARAVLAPPELVIDVRSQRIRVGGQVLKPSPAHFAIMAVLAYRTCQRLEPLRAPVKGAKDLDWSREYLENLRSVCGDMNMPNGVEEAVSHGVDADYFSPHLSKLRRWLERNLGVAAHAYQIDDGNTRPRRYKLAIPPDCIRFAHIEADPKSKTRKP